jgi:hypothetical protein
MTWDYEGANVIYFPSQKEVEYDVNISWLLEDLLYKVIPLRFYVRIKSVMDREHAFIAWDPYGMNVKYLPLHVLDVLNLPEDLLYENILIEFHVYDTQDYF